MLKSLSPTVLVFKDGALEGGVVMMVLSGLVRRKTERAISALPSIYTQKRMKAHREDAVSSQEDQSH